MKNLKKRILSFVSAAAMAVSLLPTTSLFASAETVTIDVLNGTVFDARDGELEQTFPVEIPADGTYSLDVVYQGNHNAWFKLKVGDVVKFDNRMYGGWVNNDYWESSERTYHEDLTLTAGTLNVLLLANDWGQFKSVTLTGEVDDSLGDVISNLEVIRNNNAYGVVSKSNTNDLENYYVNEKLTATANDGYKFKNWTYEDAQAGTSTLISTNSTLTLTSAMAGKTIFANFGKINKVRYEAEDFVNLVSEGFVTKSNGDKLSNKDYFNEKTGHTYGGYDDPRVVEDNNKTNLTQEWDGKIYNEHKIAPEYSNGKAVALTGPSSAIAIPLTLTEALTDDTTIKLGYNFGDMPTYYYAADNSGYESYKAVYVNLYMTSRVSSDVANALTSHGWKVSGNATPNYASNMLLRDSDTNDDGHSELQTAYYYELPKQADRIGTKADGTTQLASGTHGEGRDTCQEKSITLPAGLPAGKYYLSVATDKSNVSRYGAECRTYDTDGAVQKTYASEVGTAYYDYIEFEYVEEPGKPSPFTVGANFIFTDKWGNDLMLNSFSAATYNEGTGKIMFHPSAPRYLVAQGYNIVGWTVEKLENGTYVPVVGLNVAENQTDEHGYVSLRNDGGAAYNWTTEKGNIDSGCLAINGASFAAGSTVRFTADYAVAVAPKELTVTNGKLYGMANRSDTELRSLLADGTTTTVPVEVPNFGEVRLESSFDAGEFGYWDLNGMIYSYEDNIHFAAWTNGAFTAHIKGNNVNPTAVAFIDSIVRTSGFEEADVNYHKITFDCAFYVPSNASYVSSGIVYSNDTNAVKNARVAVDENTGALTVTSNTAGKNVLYNTVKANLLLGGKDSNKYNRQVMVSLSNMKSGVSRAARAYMIYKQDGVYKLVLSGNVVTAKAATDPQSSSVSVN